MSEISEEKACFILRVLDLAKGEWENESDTPEMFLAANKIKERYAELRGRMGFDQAAKVARVEFLTGLNL